MKKLYVLSVIIGFVILLSSIGTKEIKITPKILKSTGPPACYSKEPPNNVSCTFSGCHSDNKSNSGNASVLLDLGDSNLGYTPNKTYTISITINKPGMLRAGFQIIAVQDNNTSISPGIISLLNTTETQILNISDTHGGNCDATNKSWIEHTFNGTDVLNGSKTWAFKWTAPATNVGNISFYLAALEANDDQDNFGDFTYTLSKVMAYNPSAGLEGFILSNNIYISQNPSNEEINIHYNSDFIIDQIELLNLKGESLLILNKSFIQTQKENYISLNTNNISNGIYFIKVKSNGGELIKKVIIIK
jgi:hypothetical protein